MLAYAVVVIGSQEGPLTNYSIECSFDTNSGRVGMDDRCTACTSNKVKDFEGPLIKAKRSIKGFGGTRTTNVKMRGTIAWRWVDKEGKEHKLKIPNSYYVPEGNARPLHPQHWAQTQSKNHRAVGTGFYYVQEQYDPLICEPAQVVSDDENDGKDEEVDEQREVQPTTTDAPICTSFDLDGPTDIPTPTIIEDQEDCQPSNLSAQLLRHHQQFGHVSFKKLQEMAKQGMIPKRLAKCPVPAC
jgi:hypothetical protein